MNQFEELYNQGNYQELLELVITDLSTIEAKYWRLTALWALGQLDEALDYALKVNKTIQEENISWKAKLLNRIGTIYHLKGQLDPALIHYEKSLKYQKLTGDNKEIAGSLNNIGVVYQEKGELDNALTHYKRSLKLKKDLSDDLDIALTLNNIGTIYNLKGELDQALKHYERSLELLNNIGNSSEIAMLLINIGDLYRMKGEVRMALDCYEKSLKINKKTGIDQDLAISYVNLIETYVYLDQQEKAKSYLDKLNNEIPDNNDKVIQLYKDYTSGLVLKASKRTKDKVKAQIIFKNLVEFNDFSFEILMNSLNHLVELLIYEYKTFEEEIVLQEINKYTKQMHEIAKSQHMFSTLIDVLILRSRLSIIQYDFDKAQYLLSQALLNAEEKNMKRYITKVKEEQNNLKQDLIQLKKGVKSGSTRSKIEESSLLDYIKNIGKLVDK